MLQLCCGYGSFFLKRGLERSNCICRAACCINTSFEQLHLRILPKDAREHVVVQRSKYMQMPSLCLYKRFTWDDFQDTASHAWCLWLLTLSDCQVASCNAMYARLKKHDKNDSTCKYILQVPHAHRNKLAQSDAAVHNLLVVGPRVAP